VPLFSVIVPTYNRRELQRQALASVWAQTFTDYEVIVVDDGSTDGTWDELQALGSRIRALYQENAGPGAARNLGARHATGDYLAFLDSDDLWFPWTLNIFAELILNHGAPSILAAKLIQFAEIRELATVCEASVKAEAFANYFASYQEGHFAGAGMTVLKRDEFLRNGGFAARFKNAEDHDLIFRLGTAPGFVQITSPVTLGWRRHPYSATTNLRATFEGCLHLVERERAGAYPGGRSLIDNRRRILTRHVRPASLDCLRHGLRAEAWRLYLATFAWHVETGRWKYLLGFPIRALLC
jgi:glycosyltransferase involved in cell wall biosynthesis